MIDLVTGTYNRFQMLKDMLASAVQSAHGIPLHFIVVDGGSTDGTLEWCREQSTVTLIEQGQLLGACRAFNAGFGMAAARYTLVANDDIEFEGDTILRAVSHLERLAGCGGVAFVNRPVGRGEYLAYPMGYLMIQVGLVRTWLVKLVGGWGTDYKTYAGDAEMSINIWRAGFSIDKVEGCSILDKQPQDDLRKANEGQVERDDTHPDNRKFYAKWSGQLPHRDDWRPLPISRLSAKIASKTVRTLRFKIHPGSDPIRTSMIDAFREYGAAEQVDQTQIVKQFGVKYLQNYANKIIGTFKPDIVMLQAQENDNIAVNTVRQLKEYYPSVIFVNFNGDVRNTVSEFCVQMAHVCHLSLIASPDLFPAYLAGGAGKIAYWPIAYDKEFENVQWTGERGDIVFLGSHYMGFPLSLDRYNAVRRLQDSGLPFRLFGIGWDIPTAGYTADDRVQSAIIYAGAALAVSISQFNLWGYTSDRLYQICATGCPAMVKRFRGMEAHGFVDNRTCFAWDTPTDLVDRCFSLLHDRDTLAEVGRAGRELVTTRHNYKNRVAGLLNMLEGIT